MKLSKLVVSIGLAVWISGCDLVIPAYQGGTALNYYVQHRNDHPVKDLVDNTVESDKVQILADKRGCDSRKDAQACERYEHAVDTCSVIPTDQPRELAKGSGGNGFMQVAQAKACDDLKKDGSI